MGEGQKTQSQRIAPARGVLLLLMGLYCILGNALFELFTNNNALSYKYLFSIHCTMYRNMIKCRNSYNSITVSFSKLSNIDYEPRLAYSFRGTVSAYFVAVTFVCSEIYNQVPNVNFMVANNNNFIGEKLKSGVEIFLILVHNHPMLHLRQSYLHINVGQQHDKT